jgi:hypothetical protein
VSTRKQHVAHPTLMGAPAHRPRRSDDDQPQRPLGPDDLPLERLRSQEDHKLAEELFPSAYPSRYVMAAAQRSGSAEVASASRPSKPEFLRVIAGRLLGRGPH